MTWSDFDPSAVLLALRDVINMKIFVLGDRDVTPVTLLYLVGLYLLTTQVSRALQVAIARASGFRGVNIDESSLAVGQRFVHYLTLTVGVIVALASLGIDLGALVTAGAVFAVGIGLAMQNLAQNFVSGMILLMEGSIKPTDIVEVEGRVVQVKQMGMRATIARTRDGEHLIIPNNNLVQATVKNLTHEDRNVRISVLVGCGVRVGHDQGGAGAHGNGPKRAVAGAAPRAHPDLEVVRGFLGGLGDQRVGQRPVAFAPDAHGVGACGVGCTCGQRHHHRVSAGGCARR